MSNPYWPEGYWPEGYWPEAGGAAEGGVAEVVSESYPSLIRRKKKIGEDGVGIGEHASLRALDYGREVQRIEAHRQVQIAAVRDANLQKAQTALQEKRDREQRISKERMKNLEKARKSRWQ